MDAKMNPERYPTRFGSRALAAGLLIGMATMPSLAAQEQKEQAVVSKTGSGAKYQTVIQRSTQGELSKEDFRQASVLASQTVMHLNDAVIHLIDERADRARTEMEKARTLIKVLRDLLPVTTVETRVQSADGKEIYKHTARVQDDQIPIYEEMISVEVIEPIAEAKKEQAALKGVRLADAELVRTSVLVDLDLVERKLRRAGRLLKEEKGEDALAHLVLAQTRGVRFVANKQDDPLVEAQIALRLAERMAMADRAEAAKVNLRLASANLELYRTLLRDDRGDQKVRELEQDLRKLVSTVGDLEHKEVAAKIRGLWQRVAAMFQSEPRQTQAIGAGTDGARAAEAAAARTKN